MDATTTIKTLRYDQKVRHANWPSPFFARVFTIEGYARKHGYPVDLTVSRCQAQNEPLASTIQTGSCLHNSEALRRQEANEYATAVVLADGERVVIEGRHYLVQFIGRNAGRFPVNSDPIHFIPVEG